MTTLFRRAFALTVGTLRITGLDVSFRVRRSLKREPNTCEVSIWNLNETNRQALRELRVVPVRLEAGYVDGLATIFEGDLRDVHTERDGPDLITRLSSGDGERALQRSRVNRSYGPQTSLRQVTEGAITAMRVDVGNAIQAIAAGDFEGAGRLFSEGVVLSGNAATELDGLLASQGLEYSVQNGQLQVLPRGQPLAGTAVLLTAGTGLIGSPSEGSDGIVKARCLMIPDVYPGRRIEFRSTEVSGFFRTETAEYTGDTASDTWGIEVEAKRQEVRPT